jgi:hypothetical protein
MLEMDSVLSSVNYPVIVPAVTGGDPAIIARGTDTNIDAKITPKGTGAVIAGGSGLQLPGFATGSLPTASAHAKTLAWDNTLSKPTYSDGSTWTAVGTGSGGGTAQPAPLTGNYFYPICRAPPRPTPCPTGSCTPCPSGSGPRSLYPDRRDVSVIGDSGSKIRLGIYGDTGSYYPGTLVLDAGQIAGDSATRQRSPSRKRCRPDGYWLVGVGQSITTTAPTIPPGQRVDAALPARARFEPPIGQHAGLLLLPGSVTGALPSNFSSTVQISSRAPWLILKAA